jgi:hypothetical protein
MLVPQVSNSLTAPKKDLRFGKEARGTEVRMVLDEVLQLTAHPDRSLLTQLLNQVVLCGVCITLEAWMV